MEITPEEFDRQFRETIDTLLQTLADHSDVGLQEFYHMTYVLENLSFFGPILYDALQKLKR